MFKNHYNKKTGINPAQNHSEIEIPTSEILKVSSQILLMLYRFKQGFKITCAK
jgi:hypothetical protein